MHRSAPYGRAVRLLKKHKAPDEVIRCFTELFDINGRLDSAMKSPADDLLLDACKRFGFSAIYETNRAPRHIRARLLDHQHVSYAADCSPDPESGDAPAREQGFRRGYDQGFGEACRRMQKREPISVIAAREKEIHAWRIAPVQTIGSYPGAAEEVPDLGLAERCVSPRLRYKVLTRDRGRCQLCGRSATDGVTLEVDHKISLAAGGPNDEDNLWTLCAECNRGKSSDCM